MFTINFLFLQSLRSSLCSDGIHEHGVGAIISSDIAKCIGNFVPISERTMLLQINAIPTKIKRRDLLEIFAESNDQDKPEKIVRNQIDYLLRNRRFRNSCTSVKTCPGADIESDHVPLVGLFKTRMKRVRTKTPKIYKMILLKEQETKRKVNKSMILRINWKLNRQLTEYRRLWKI